MAGCVSMSGLVYRLEGELPNLFLFLTLFLRHVNNPPLATYVTQSKPRLFSGGTGQMEIFLPFTIIFQKYSYLCAQKPNTLINWKLKLNVNQITR